MEDMKERTAADTLPWHVEADDTVEPIFGDGDYLIIPAKGAGPVAVVCGKERAALIVRAVNSFTALKEQIAKLEAALDVADEFRQLFVADTDPASLDFDFSEASPDVVMTMTQSWDEASKASKEARTTLSSADVGEDTHDEAKP